MSDGSLPLDGATVVVTAGGTREPIDPVRYLGNRSSGKMGNALARAAAAAGARVTLITAADSAPVADGVAAVHVETAEDMLHAVREAVRSADVLVMAAAVADYKPAQHSTTKLRKRTEPWDLRLVPTVDILRTVAAMPERERLFVVGFAAETGDLVESAQRKLREKGLDLIVLNDVSRNDIAMGSDHNEVTVLDSEGVVEHVPRASKDDVAHRLTALIAERLR